MNRRRSAHDPLYRTACRIRDHLEGHREASRMPGLLSQWLAYTAEAHQAVARTQRRITLARGRGWHLAAAKLHEDLFYQAQRLQGGVQQLLALRDPPVSAVPPLSLLLGELGQLRQEFDQVEVRPDNGRVVATTDPLVLGGVDLGRFAIELHLRRLAGSPPDSSSFDCVALDPNPAHCDASVTHPHVRDKALCAGDASAPIAEALRQGRLCDAFVLVRSVLQDYNPHSPYVPLSDWEGETCPDCGHTAPRDDLCYCEGCERDVCSDCTGTCDVCDDSCCGGCLERDGVSRRHCCPSCRHTCSECERVVDRGSFDEDSGLCPECLHSKLRQAEEQEDEPEYDEPAVEEQLHNPQPQEDPTHAQFDQPTDSPTPNGATAAGAVAAEAAPGAREAA